MSQPKLTFLFWVTLSLFVAFTFAQFSQTIVVDSTSYVSGLDLFFNETTQNFDYQSGFSTGYIRVRGGPGGFINLKVMSQGTNGTFYQSNEVNIQLGTVIFPYTVQNRSFIPEQGGTFYYQAFIDLADSDNAEMNWAIQSLQNEVVLGGSLPTPTTFNTAKRKRSFDDPFEADNGYYTSDGMPLKFSKPIKPEDPAETKKARREATNIFKMGNVEIEVKGSLSRILAAQKAMVDAAKAGQTEEASRRKRSITEDVESLQEKLYRVTLAQAFGFKPEDYHKVMPDSHYLFQHEPGVWVPHSDLSMLERFKLRLEGKVFHVNHQVEHDPTLAELAALLKREYHLKIQIGMMQEKLEALIAQNYTALQATHMMYEGPETLQIHRMRRDNTDQGPALDNTFWTLCSPLIVLNIGASAGACIVSGLALLNNGLSSIQSNYAGLLALLQTQAKIDQQLSKTVTDMFSAIVNIQSELNVMQAQLQTTQSQIQTLQNIASQQAYTDQMQAMQSSALGAQIQTSAQVTAQTQQNIINAQSGSANAQQQVVIQMQQQISNVGQLAAAMNDHTSATLLAALAEVSAQQTRNNNNMYTNIRFQLAGITSEINNWMSQKDTDLSRIFSVIASLISTSRALNEATKDIYQNIFLPGNMSLAYYSTELILSQYRGGNMQMLVDPRTRLPPRNISEYTVIYNLNVLFNYTNPQAPGVYGNATAMAEIKAIADAIVNEYTLITIQYPVGLDPDSVVYITTLDGIPDLSFFDPTLRLFQLSFLVQDSHGNQSPMLMNITNGAVTLMNDTTSNRASSHAALFFIGTNSDWALSHGAVLDGDTVYLYAIQGTHVYMVDFVFNSGTNFNISIVPLPDSGSQNSTGIMTRILNGTMEGLIYSWLTNVTVTQGKPLYFVPVLPPITTTGAAKQAWFVKDPTTISSINMNPGDPTNPLTLVSATFYRTNPAYPPGNASFTGVTSSQANATADNAWNTFQDTPLTNPGQSRKRSLPEDSCYSGITVVTSNTDQYGGLNGASVNRLNQCIAKPGCMYTKVWAPQTVTLYANQDWTGASSEYVTPPSNIHASSTSSTINCDFTGGTLNSGNNLPAHFTKSVTTGLGTLLPWQSAIIPPSISADFDSEYICWSRLLMNQNSNANACTLNGAGGFNYNGPVNRCLGFESVHPPFDSSMGPVPNSASGICTQGKSFTFAGNSGPWAFGASQTDCHGCACTISHAPPIWFYQNPVAPSSTFWEFCYPEDPTTYNAQPQDAWTSYAMNLPYFFSPNDIGMGPTHPTLNYNPKLVQLQVTFPSCDQLSVSQCNQLSRKGMCTTYVDPSNTVVFPSSATVGDYCDSVSVNPCSGATDPTTCIGITAFNGTMADVDNPVPMCMWNVHTSSCIPMDPLEIGTQDVTPTSATSTVALNYDIPCGYRDATIEWNCVYDGNCYAFQSPQFLSDSVSYPRLCLPLTNLATYQNIFENPTPGIPFAAIGDLNPTSLTGLLNNELSISVSLCGQRNAQCSLRKNTGTLLLTYLLNLINGLTEIPDLMNQCAGTSLTIQPMFAVGSTTICTSSYLFYDPSFEFSFDDADHQSMGLVSACQSYSNQCVPKCELYGTDLQSCENAGGQTFCFITNNDLSCHTSTLANMQQYCSYGAQNTFGPNSNCLVSSNICAMLPANLTMNGTVIALSDFDQAYDGTGPNPNTALLATSQCSVLGGYGGVGNLSMAGEVDRFVNLTLPTILSNLCTAVISATGQLTCQQATLVTGGCALGSVCDLYSNGGDAIGQAANLIQCNFPTPALCVTASPNPGQDIGNCGWLYSNGDFNSGSCTDLSSCQSTASEQLTSQCATSRNLASLNSNAFTQRTGSPNSFIASGVDPRSAVQTMLSVYGTMPLMIGSVKTQCANGATVHGFMCCADSTCTSAFVNQWDPQIAFQNAFQQVAARNAPVGSPSPTVQVQTVIVFAGIGMTSPVDNTTFFYSIEPFVTDQGALLFTFDDPNERPKQKILLDRAGDTWDMMVPLMVHSPTGSVMGDFRSCTPLMNYTVYNTNYRFNLINNIVGTTLANQNVPIFNDTRMARTQLTAPVNNSGIFDLILDASVSLPPLMTQLIQLRVAALVNQYGNATQAWGSSPPYGVTIENLAPGVDTNGNPTSGGKVMIVAYCDKYFYIPIQEVTDQRPVIFTGTVSVNGGTPVGPASNAFFSPYASMLPNVGMRFVDYWNTTTNMLFSANHDEIGIGEPYKLGFIYSNFFDPDYDYVLNNVPSQNPYLNARYFKKWADQYSSTITGTPDPGSCDRLCGSLLTQTQVTPGQNQFLAQLEFLLNFNGIGANNTALWLQRINNTSPQFAFAFASLIPSMATLSGCKGYILNTNDPGQLTDNFALLWVMFVNETAQTIDQVGMQARVTAIYYTPQNRADCGNCFLVIPPPSQDLINSNPTINFCDNSFANSTSFGPPTTANIQLAQATQSAFCLQCPYWNITNDMANSVLYYTALNGQGILDLTFPIPIDAVLIAEYTANTFCPTVLETVNQTTINPGHYVLFIDNSIPPVLKFEIRVRTDPTLFSTPASALPTCNYDYDNSIGSNVTNVPFVVSICPNQLSYVQVFNPNGTACSTIFVTEFSYSPGELGSLQDVQTKIEQYDSSFLLVQNDLNQAFNQLETSLTTQINGATESIVTLQNSLFAQGQSNSINFSNLQGQISSTNSELTNGLAGVTTDTTNQIRGVNFTVEGLNGTLTNTTVRVGVIEGTIQGVIGAINSLTNASNIFNNQTLLYQTIAQAVYANFGNITADIIGLNALINQFNNQLASLIDGANTNASNINTIIIVAAVLAGLCLLGVLALTGVIIYVMVQLRSPAMRSLLEMVSKKQEEIVANAPAPSPPANADAAQSSVTGVVKRKKGLFMKGAKLAANLSPVPGAGKMVDMAGDKIFGDTE